MEEGKEMQKLYDSNMQLIGYSATGASGKITVYDSDYRILGYYNPQSDKTYDRDRKLIGKGDLTTVFFAEKIGR